MKKRLAALLVVPAIVLGASLVAVGTANADGGGGGGGSVCRPPEIKDGLSIHTCAKWSDDQHTAHGEVTTTGSNNTDIELCVELVDVNQNLVPGSRGCSIQPGSHGFLAGPIVSPPPGTYYAVSYFTSPTYFYGGETPAFSLS